MSTDAAIRPSAVPWPPILIAGAIAAALLLARMLSARLARTRRSGARSRRLCASAWPGWR